MEQLTNTVLVLFSGGQDSTTCLGWAFNHFEHVITLGFNYGQRHNIEMECRKTLLKELRFFSSQWSQKLGTDHIINTDFFNNIGETALTNDIPIKHTPQGIINTFVPGRNLIFLTTAAAFAWKNNIEHIIIGACETDYSGYPDCHNNTIQALQIAINLGMSSNITIHTPLMFLNKREVWELALKTGGEAFIELILTKTHTCYLGNHENLNSWGYGCGECPACVLRKQGWENFIQQK